MAQFDLLDADTGMPKGTLACHSVQRPNLDGATLFNRGTGSHNFRSLSISSTVVEQICPRCSYGLTLIQSQEDGPHSTQVAQYLCHSA